MVRRYGGVDEVSVGRKGLPPFGAEELVWERCG